MRMISLGGRQLSVFILIILLVFLTGCVKGQLHATVHRDGSVDLNYLLTVPKSIDKRAPDPLKQLREEAAEAGFTVQLVDLGERSGFRATRRLATPAQLPEFGKSLTQAGSKSSLHITRGLLWDKYLFETEMPIEEFGLLDDLGLGEAFLSRMKLDFILTMPGRVSRTNASEIQEDGRTVIWVLDPQGENALIAETRVFAWGNLLLIFIVLTVAVGVIFGINVRNKKVESIN